MTCSYCDKPATLRIPAIPDAVCGAHAEEFWSELLAYAKDERADGIALTPTLVVGASGAPRVELPGQRRSA